MLLVLMVLRQRQRRLAPLQHILDMHWEGLLLVLLVLLVHFRLLVDVLVHLLRGRVLHRGGLELRLRGQRGGLLRVHGEDFGLDFLEGHELLALWRGAYGGRRGGGVAVGVW